MKLLLCKVILMFFLLKMAHQLGFRESTQHLHLKQHSRGSRCCLSKNMYTIADDFSFRVQKPKLEIKIPFFINNLWKTFSELKWIFIFPDAEKSGYKWRTLCNNWSFLFLARVFSQWKIMNFKLFFCLNGTFLNILGMTF